MASNRKLPFGYKMEFGEIVIHPVEAVVVQKIFQQYISGESYKSLVDMLREQDVPYIPGKPWNKNMVARILENKKYVGEDGWPVIVPAEQYEHANEKRTAKVTPPTKTETQKVLRKLCCGGPAAEAEQTVLRLLNDLIAAPEKICVPEIAAEGPAQEENIGQALKAELENQPVNEDAAKSLALELASARYAAIGNQEYETMRLRWLFMRYTPMQELGAEILRSAVASIHLRRGQITIRLKNGQMVGG